MSKKINVICHASPDDDTRCANEVLSNWLTRNGKIVKTCINENKTKSLYISKSAYHTKEDFTPSDLAVAVDFSSESKNTKIVHGTCKKIHKKQPDRLRSPQETIRQFERQNIQRQQRNVMLAASFTDSSKALEKLSAIKITRAFIVEC